MGMLQAKQGQMQRDPSEMDANRGGRPMSPGSGENAPSPSKRPRLEFAPNQQAGLMHNGRPVGQGMGGQQVGAGPMTPQVHQMLLAHGVNPASLSAEQVVQISNQSPSSQLKNIQAYSQNLQQHHNAQLPNKALPNVSGPPGQGSPMIQQGGHNDGAALSAYYNAGEIGPGGMRAGGPGAPQAGGGSNHALQDYQMQLMLLEQQNKKRLMMARQEQDGIVGIRADGTPGMSGAPGGPGQPGGPGGPGGPVGPGGPGGPNGIQSFQGASPQGRPGASPNPGDQMKRQQQMGGAGMGSPLPDNPQSRGSPNPVNFMGQHMDPNMSNFYKGGMEGNMAAQQMNGMRTPSGAHPGAPFNPQMNQQMMVARQQQVQQQQQQQAAAAAGGQGGPQIQWQPGAPNGGPMNGPQGPQGQQVQQGPQQRAMAPPSAPGANAAANTNQRATESPQTSSAAPPTPQTAAKANPKKKDGKGTKKVCHILRFSLFSLGHIDYPLTCNPGCPEEVHHEPQRSGNTRVGNTR